MRTDPLAVPSDQISLNALKLKPGMFMQLHFTEGASGAAEAQFCAAIRGKGIMLVPLASHGAAAVDLKPGAHCRVRGFTGTHDYGFDSRVIQSFEIPFPYTLIAYPEQAHARQVRQAQRIRTSLPAEVSGSAAGARVAARVVDLSPSGALVSAQHALGSIGDMLKVSFAVDIDGKAQTLLLDAAVCHSIQAEGGDGYRSGLAFRNVSRADRLALQCYAMSVEDNGAVI